MCRLLGQISLEPASAFDGLAGDPRSLLALSDLDPARLQADGWGIGWYAGSRPRIVKSPSPAFRERPRFVGTARSARARVVIGHIRRASNPRGLPKRRLLSPANAQPFAHGSVLFAHNGQLNIPDEIAKFLGAYRRRLRGLNDSEVYFWQFIKFLDAYGSVPEALKACIRETAGVWRGCRARYPRFRAPYTGLNAVVSDGRSLHALCHFPHDGGAAALGGSQPYGRMSLGRRDGKVIVASEAQASGRWTLSKPAEIVSVTPAGRRLAVKRERFSPGG